MNKKWHEIDDLGLTVRSYNCLDREGIHTIAQLRAMSDKDLLRLKNFGRKSLPNVKQALLDYEKSYSGFYDQFLPAIVDLSARQMGDFTGTLFKETP